MTHEWWVQQPPDIVMTDMRARALLSGNAQPKDSKEKIFVNANTSTAIPEAEVKIVPPGQSLGLHHPGSVGHQSWQDQDG